MSAFYVLIGVFVTVLLLLWVYDNQFAVKDEYGWKERIATSFAISVFFTAITVAILWITGAMR